MLFVLFLTIPINQIEQNFTYMYNVCGTVSGDIPKTCAGLTGINQAGAIQVDARGTSSVEDDYCFVVGLFESSTNLRLINQQDPSKGVALTYYGEYW